ncbi:MAG: sulfotransferase domain-containing protein, partial [Planctomycetota bacterium]
EKINSLESFDDQLLFEMQRMSVFDIGQMRDFDYDDDRFMTVKYEDMICDYDMRRFEEIFRFMGISEQAMGWCLTLALRNCLFSGSVKSTHVRSGKGKQWVEHFKPQHKEKFDELFPGILDRLGYEPGDSWNER